MTVVYHIILYMYIYYCTTISTLIVFCNRIKRQEKHNIIWKHQVQKVILYIIDFIEHFIESSLYQPIYLL